MTKEQKVIRAKVGLLELARQLGNVSQACKMMGYSRDSFYRFKDLYDAGGELALQELTRRKPILKNRVDPTLETKLVELSLEWPAFGQIRIGNELRKLGFSISPAGVFVSPESPVKTPADLKGVPISVGYQSGSHYATIQALEQYMALDDIKLSFGDGLLFSRMEMLIDRKVPAATLFSGPYYFLEQLGFRKVIDATFMMASMITGEPDPEDVRKYFRALRRAQRDIDLRPELYTHYYKKEFPVRFHGAMDPRRWGPGERIVFETYTREVYRQSFEWIAGREIFAEGHMGPGDYDKATVSFATR